MQVQAAFVCLPFSAAYKPSIIWKSLVIKQVGIFFLYARLQIASTDDHTTWSFTNASWHLSWGVIKNSGASLSENLTMKMNYSFNVMPMLSWIIWLGPINKQWYHRVNNVISSNFFILYKMIQYFLINNFLMEFNNVSNNNDYSRIAVKGTKLFDLWISSVIYFLCHWWNRPRSFSVDKLSMNVFWTDVSCRFLQPPLI